MASPLQRSISTARCSTTSSSSRSTTTARGDIGPKGTVKVALFRLAGSDFSCADSPVTHAWGFTPAVSLWIDCDDENELQRLFDRLSDGGMVFMPLDDYGFSSRFGWVGDRLRGDLAAQLAVTTNRQSGSTSC